MRRTTLIIAIAVAAAGLPQRGSAGPLTVTVADRPIVSPALLVSGHVLLPLRETFETLNSSVAYDPATKKVTARNIVHTVTLRIADRAATLDGRAVTLEVAARIVNGQVYVPLRFAAQGMGAIIRYDPRTKTVAVNGSDAPRRDGREAIAQAPQTLIPPPNASVVTAYPIVSASLGGGISAASNAVALVLDGADVTAQTSFDGRTITYVPKAGLELGTHTVAFSGRTATGQPFSTQWSFQTNAPPMRDDASYANGDYRFFAGPPQPYGAGAWMNLTLIAPPAGSGYAQICSPQFIYPLWNGGYGQRYRARVALPFPSMNGGCPITGIFIGRSGRPVYVPIASSNGIFLTGSPLFPIGQYPAAPIYVPLLHRPPHR